MSKSPDPPMSRDQMGLPPESSLTTNMSSVPSLLSVAAVPPKLSELSLNEPVR